MTDKDVLIRKLEPSAEYLYGIEISCFCRSLSFSSSTYKSIEFIKETFFPHGAFNVKISVINPDDINSRDLSISESILADLDFKEILNQLSEYGELFYFNPSEEVVSYGYRFGGFEVFSLSDGEDAETLLVRRNSKLHLLHNADSDYSRKPTRIVREIVSRWHNLSGYVGFHGSCFTVGGKYYIAVGDSGSGKTTLALAMGKYGNDSTWVGNDRTYLSISDDPLVAAFPLPVAVNYGSLVSLDWVNCYKNWNLIGNIPPDDSDWKEYNGERKIKINNKEVERELKITVGTVGCFGGIVLPSVDSKLPCTVKPVSIDDHIDVIRRNCLALNDELFPSNWLSIGDTLYKSEKQFESIYSLISKYPTYKVAVSKYEHTKLVSNELERLIRLESN